MNWDYEHLKKMIGEYLGRDDLADLIPHFIDLAEREMQTELRLRCMERQGTHLTSPKTAALALPDKRIPGDWDVYLDMREVALDGQPMVNLEYVNPDEFTDLAGGSGQPRQYTILGRELHFAPTPDAEYTVILSYYAEIPPLGDNQPTNDFLLRNPMLYLYGALTKSAAWTRSSAPLELWEREYLKAKTDLQFSDRQARFSKQIRARSPRR